MTDNELQRNELDDGRCNGITRAGNRCTFAALPGSYYCKMHSRPAEVASRHEAAGRYAASMSPSLVPDYQMALQDRYLLHLRDEIAVITTRTNQLMGQTDDGVNVRAWQEVKQIWERFKKAYRQDDQKGMNELMLRLDELIATGKRESDVWTDIERLLEQRRRLVETEQKHLKATGQTVTTEAVMVLLAAAITAIKESVRKYVSSRDIQEAIIVDAQYEYRKLVGDFGSGESA